MGDVFYAHPKNRVYDSPILKLHGSLNWFSYSNFRPYQEVERLVGRAISESPPHDGYILVRHDWWNSRLPDLGGWLLEPALITPALYKQESLRGPLFSGLWMRAGQLLARTRRLVVIGYSFPPTDFHARRLFLEAFADHELDELTVVDPKDESADVARRLAPHRDYVRHRSLEEFMGHRRAA